MHFVNYGNIYLLHTYSFVDNNISRLIKLVNTVKGVIVKFIQFFIVSYP